MPNILKQLKNLNGTVSPFPSPHDKEFLSEEYSGDCPSTSLSEDLNAKVININKNTNQKLIIVTHDKTLLCLKRNIARLGKNIWIAPLSTFTTIIIALITAEFKSALWLGPAEWRAMFVISGFIALGWLVLAIHQSIRSLGTNEVIYGIVDQLGGKTASE